MTKKIKKVVSKNVEVKYKRPSWDEYFISIAEKVAEKSKDPSTKTSAVIVDENNRPVSFGYNGFMAGCNEKFMSQERPIKYHLVIHGEMNAILFARRSLENCTLYSLYAPCEDCLKHIIQTGIKRIVYKNQVVESKRNNNDKSMTTPVTDEAITRLLLSSPRIKCYRLNGKSYLQEMWGKNIPKF